MSFLKTQGLGLRFGERWILQDLDLEITAGDFVCLLGPSGCGKSTLLRLLSGLLQPSTGSIEKTAGSVSFVFQEPRLLPWRTVRENVLLPFEILGEPAPNPEEILRTVDLWQARDYFPHQLSGGMKQRASIARALMTKPKLLLMDEPLSALDEATRENLEGLLRNLWQTQKMTLIFVTHSIPESVFLGERLLLMSRQQGRFVIDERTNLGPRSADSRTSLAFVEVAKQVGAALRGLPA